MRWFPLFAGLTALANAQHLHLDIPEVDHYVEHALKKFSKYVHPHPATNVPGPQKTKVPEVPEASAAAGSCAYWLNQIPHTGVAAFGASGYQVYRNVRDFGAKGDGVTDDTAAINAAISSGGRCGPGTCDSSTTSPAVVYFPPGTYLVSGTITDYYLTQIIGNPNCLPTIKVASNFPSGGYVIDGDPYLPGGAQSYDGSTDIFWRQIRNFIIDMTDVPSSTPITGVHWPTAQATSIQNVIFQMSQNSGTQHQGIFIENGSAGFLGDLIFNGGLYGLNTGNQQYTMRNLTFTNNVIAINQLWSWTWIYQGLNIKNVTQGIVANSGGTSSLSVGALVIIDSTFTDVPVAVVAGRTSGSSPPAANTLILENVAYNNVPIVVQNNGVTSLAGGTGTVTAWGQGISYTPTGPNNFQGNVAVAGNGRPASLLSGSRYYTRSKPQYNKRASSQVLTVRSQGAKGDGITDDTTAFQNAINAAVSSGKLLFIDQGDYLVTSTLTFPPGLKITGEAYPVILGSGSFFNSQSSPKPVVKIGNAGQTGAIEWSNMIVSTKGPAPGAILIQYNLKSSATHPSGLWDVHTRIGGFAGSNLQVGQCPTTQGTTITSSNLNTNCIAAYASLWITSQSTGLYMENNWLWTADHDIDASGNPQITVYTGRGLLDESAGPVWLVGTGVEHHSKYQYNFHNAKNVFAAMLQTETPYYQPNPSAAIPFTYTPSLGDPSFAATAGSGAPTVDAYGLMIQNSTDILAYGAGHYSFFNNQSTQCSNQGTDNCQESIIYFGPGNNDITIFGLATVGTQYAFNSQGTLSGYLNNELDGFTETIGWYTSNK